MQIDIAIEKYLGRKPDYISEVIVSESIDGTYTINEWNALDKVKPTIQQLQDIWDNHGLTGLKERRQQEAKDEAYRRITEAAKYGDVGPFADLKPWKQRNYIARASQLVEKKADGDTLTSGEQAELSAIKTKWASVQDIRTRVSNIEDDIAALSNENDVLAYNIKQSIRWTE